MATAQPVTSRPITKKARDGVASRISVGFLNLANFQTEMRPMDGNDVAGMLEPLLDALGELEAEVAWLKARA